VISVPRQLTKSDQAELSKEAKIEKKKKNTNTQA
jgi:hypothetical protein